MPRDSTGCARNAKSSTSTPIAQRPRWIARAQASLAAFFAEPRSPQPAPFDVVLMDLQMPEMDGYQATSKLRADERFADLPIIAMTAHATMEERQRCLAAGMNDHVSKPIDPAALFETVGRFTG